MSETIKMVTHPIDIRCPFCIAGEIDDEAGEKKRAAEEAKRVELARRTGPSIEKVPEKKTERPAWALPPEKRDYVR